MFLKFGEPCEHKGCLHHLTHPCEGCGRIGGKITEEAWLTLRKDQKNRWIAEKTLGHKCSGESIHDCEDDDCPVCDGSYLGWKGYGQIISKLGKGTLSIKETDKFQAVFLPLGSIETSHGEAYTPWEALAVIHGKMKGLIAEGHVSKLTQLKKLSSTKRNKKETRYGTRDKSHN